MINIFDQIGQFLNYTQVKLFSLLVSVDYIFMHVTTEFIIIIHNELQATFHFLYLQQHFNGMKTQSFMC